MAHNTMTTSTFLLALPLLVVLCLSSSSESQMVPAMYVFGDSLVDVGNNNYLKLSITKANFPHNGVDFPGKKATGRFSNGKNSADFFAEKVGLVTSPPYLSFVSGKGNNGMFPITGVSFASGGARILNSTGIFSVGGHGTDDRHRQSIYLSKQVEYYSSVHEDLVRQLGSTGAQDHLSKSLFVVVIGSNDLLSYFNSGSNLPQKSTPQQYVNSMISALKQALKGIYDLGARKYVVSGAPTVGCCPYVRNQNSGECNEETNKWSLNYNEGLKSMLEGLKSEVQNGGNGIIHYSFVDEYSVLAPYIQTPGTNGFTEVKAACCGLGNLNAQVPCVPISTYCSNRSDHLFWDLYHPTEAATRVSIDTFFDGSPPYVIPVNVKQLIAA